MKKISALINVTLFAALLFSIAVFVSTCISANQLFKSLHNLQSMYEPPSSLNAVQSAAIHNTILATAGIIISVMLGASIFFFNYRFDGVSFREKVAARLTESKQRKAESRLEKQEARKKKRIEELQSQLDKLKIDE